MLAGGLEDEVKKLLAMGYTPALPAMSGIGYRQMVKYLAGEMSLEQAVASMNIDSHRLARQQYNWFKPADERIRWFDITSEPYPEIRRIASEFLS